jgi:hypothetical protein
LRSKSVLSVAYPFIHCCTIVKSVIRFLSPINKNIPTPKKRIRFLFFSLWYLENSQIYNAAKINSIYPYWTMDVPSIFTPYLRLMVYGVIGSIFQKSFRHWSIFSKKLRYLKFAINSFPFTFPCTINTTCPSLGIWLKNCTSEKLNFWSRFHCHWTFIEGPGITCWPTRNQKPIVPCPSRLPCNCR